MPPRITPTSGYELIFWGAQDEAKIVYIVHTSNIQFFEFIQLFVALLSLIKTDSVLQHKMDFLSI